ncbi:MAG: hypothetical protein ACXWCG_11730 [Flavitalea sp.]
MLTKTKFLSLLVSLLFLVSCGGGKSTPTSVAKKWCDLNSKVYKASNDADKVEAEAARKKYEQEMEEKYKSDANFMAEVEKEVEKCEGASEGK